MPTPNSTRPAASAVGAEPLGPMFLSAEDFDATGILAGVEPCASNYWWIPELHPGTPLVGGATAPAVAPAAVIGQTAAPEQPSVPPRVHAARRTSRRSTAA